MTIAIDDLVAWASVGLLVCLSVTWATVLTHSPDGARHFDVVITTFGVFTTGIMIDLGMISVIACLYLVDRPIEFLCYLSW